VPRILDDRHAVSALATMVGVCSVGDGPTEEQRSLIGALARGYFHVPVTVDELPALGPDEAAVAFTTEEERRRVRHLLVLAEMCRHPLTEDQVERTEAYARSLGGDDAAMAIARDLVEAGVAAASQDFYRWLGAAESGLREPSLAGAPGSAPIGRDQDLVSRLRALQTCPEGSLGRAYVAFYDTHGFPLPGEETSSAAMFVAHDMSHVIAGYAPTGVDEIALGAMQLGIADTDEHWVQLLGNLGVHEAGFVDKGAALAALSRPRAVETVAHAFDRGARCGADFTFADHLAMVDEPLELVRERFGVPPRQR
jgi:hypothetical protein